MKTKRAVKSPDLVHRTIMRGPDALMKCTESGLLGINFVVQLYTIFPVYSGPLCSQSESYYLADRFINKHKFISLLAGDYFTLCEIRVK